MICHRCREGMISIHEGNIQGYLCQICNSHAVTLGNLRKGGVALNRLKPFWLGSKEQPAHGPQCPQCEKSMVVVQSKEGLELDVCRSCTLILFDHGELHTFVHGKTAPQHQPAQLNDPAYDRQYSPDVQLMILKKRGDQELPDRIELSPEITSFRRFFAVICIPIKRDSIEFSRKPWLTWLSIVMLWGCWIYTLSQNHNIYTDFALTPENGVHIGFSRYLIFPWFQDSISELLLVTWALFNFATDMERSFGPIPFILACLTWMTLSGGIITSFYADQEIWLLGMGGTVTLLISYFTFRFPTRELAIYFRKVGRYEYAFAGWKDRNLVAGKPIFFYPFILCIFWLFDLLILFVYTILEFNTAPQEALFYKVQLWPHAVGLCIGLGCGWLDKISSKESPS